MPLCRRERNLKIFRTKLTPRPVQKQSLQPLCALRELRGLSLPIVLAGVKVYLGCLLLVSHGGTEARRAQRILGLV